MNRCSKRVYGERWGGHPCQKPVKVERDGKWYCAIHDPVRKAEKDAEKRAAWRAEADAKVLARRSAEAAAAERKRRADCFDDMLHALRIAVMQLAHDERFSEAYETVSAAIARATQDTL